MGKSYFLRNLFKLVFGNDALSDSFRCLLGRLIFGDDVTVDQGLFELLDVGSGG